MFRSPLFLGRYTTANGRRACIENGIVVVNALPGGSDDETPEAAASPKQKQLLSESDKDDLPPFTAKVLSEELYYHKGGKSSRILFIDNMLCNSGVVPQALFIFGNYNEG